MSRGGPQPLFILSLPRSGSTLLQHLLAAHPAIAATAEPWILLPFVYALRPRGVSAEYGHDTLAQALSDFIGVAGGTDEWRACVRRWVSELYQRAAPAQAKYFLDKTPHYDLIADEVVTVFPEAKIVFLWRNPLAIAASMLATFGSSGWPLYPYAPHLFRGLEVLLHSLERAGDRAISVRYEDLVQSPDDVLQRIFGFLDLDFDPSAVEGFAHVVLPGRLKDPTWGRYQNVSRDSIDRWKRIMRGPVRKRWCLRYLRWLGPDRVRRLGYDYGTLLREVRQLDSWASHSIADVYDVAVAAAKARVKSRLLRARFYVWPPRPNSETR